MPRPLLSQNRALAGCTRAGEDMGDAHYQYRSTKPFQKYGTLDCHNRKDLTVW